MAEQEELVSTLLETMQKSQGVAELTKAMDEVDSHRRQQDLTDSQCFHLLRMGFLAIQSATQEDMATAESVIVQRLIPLVLHSAADGNHDVAAELSSLRKLLADWIEVFPEHLRTDCRQRVLQALVNALDGDALCPACWTIARIGFRDRRIVNRLWSVVETKGEHRGTALSTVVSLGVPLDARKRILDLIETEGRVGLKRSMRYILQELAAPESVVHVFRLIEERLEETEEPRRDVSIHMAISLLRRLLDREWEDETFQSRVWTKLTQIAEEGVPGNRRRLDLRSDIGRECNTPEVIPYYLGSLVESVASEQEQRDAGWLPLMQLKECVRPSHMEGWQTVRDRSEFIDALSRLATGDTGQNIDFVTTQTRAKRAAWDHLLNLRARQTLDFVEEAVANETSPYVQGDVLERVACLAFRQLPPSVQRLVTEEFSCEPRGDTGQFAARLAAAQVARSAATPEAFDALLDFGLTHGGSTLISSMEAIGDVAVALVKAGNSEIPLELCSKALAASDVRHREGAIGGLLALAHARQMGKETVSPLMELVRDNSLSTYARARVLEAIGLLPRGVLDDEDAAYVLRLVSDPSQNRESTYWRAVELLIRHEILPSDDYDGLLCQILSLQKSDQVWVLDRTDEIDEWQGYSIALLWCAHPESFTSAVAEVVRHAKMTAIYPTLGVLTSPKVSTVEPRASLELVADAIVDRVKLRMTRSTAETEVFAVLRCVDPRRLVDERWDQYWGNWLPEAQVTLANELALAHLDEPESASRAFVMLTALTGEGSYAVRRAAYRAMAQIIPDALDKHCLQWANGPVDERRRAAEAAGWSHEQGDERLQTSVLATLLVDPERGVRDAANRTVQDRQRRLWADDYLNRVLAVRENGNDALLQAHCYGEALVQVGDDGHQHQLEEHLATTDLPLHVRYWLRQLVEGIEKRWRTVTEEWPEPWIGWGGISEELDGSVDFGDGSPINAHFSLWRKGRASPSDFASWGGVVRSSGLGFRLLAGGNVTLRFPGRCDAVAIVSQFKMRSSDPGSGYAVLTGSGAYPEKEPES